MNVVKDKEPEGLFGAKCGNMCKLVGSSYSLLVEIILYSDLLWSLVDEAEDSWVLDYGRESAGGVIFGKLFLLLHNFSTFRKNR